MVCGRSALVASRPIRKEVSGVFWGSRTLFQIPISEARRDRPLTAAELPQMTDPDVASLNGGHCPDCNLAARRQGDWRRSCYSYVLAGCLEEVKALPCHPAGFLSGIVWPPPGPDLGLRRPLLCLNRSAFCSCSPYLLAAPRPATCRPMRNPAAAMATPGRGARDITVADVLRHGMPRPRFDDRNRRSTSPRCRSSSLSGGPGEVLLRALRTQ